MKILKEGHKYELESLEGSNPQIIQFIEKDTFEAINTITYISHGDLSSNSDKMITICDGTTNEEVLKILIDRLYYLNKKVPCRENSIVITKLEECLMWLNKRTEDRKKRNIEGTSSK